MIHDRNAPARTSDIPLVAHIDLHSQLRLQGKYIYLKIYGERNTGSNYLEHLCDANFVVCRLRGDSGVLWETGTRLLGTLDADQSHALQQAIHDIEMQRMLRSDFGWKHAAPPVDVILEQPHALQTVFLIITKHPYSWAQSLFRQPYSFRPTETEFSRFLRSGFPTSFSDCLRTTGPVTPLTMFRRKALGYAELMRSGLCVRHIRYEDLLTDGRGQLEALLPILVQRGTEFVDIENDVKGSGRTRDDFTREYTLNATGRHLDEADRAFIVQEVGADVFEWLGYQP